MYQYTYVCVQWRCLFLVGSFTVHSAFKCCPGLSLFLSVSLEPFTSYGCMPLLGYKRVSNVTPQRFLREKNMATGPGEPENKKDCAAKASSKFSEGTRPHYQKDVSD